MISNASSCQNGLTEPDTVFRNVIAAPLAGRGRAVLVLQFRIGRRGVRRDDRGADLDRARAARARDDRRDAERLQVAGVLLGDVVHLVDARDGERVADLDRADVTVMARSGSGCPCSRTPGRPARPAWSRRHVALVGAVHRHADTGRRGQAVGVVQLVGVEAATLPT
jgi:hypothetical protein